MGKTIHTIMTVITYVFLGGLAVTVGGVLLVVVGPILLEIDILADPTYTRIEVFLRRMLLYIVVSAIGYVFASWGRRLSEPEERPEPRRVEMSRPAPPVARQPHPRGQSSERATSSHAYRPEVVPPTHP